MNFSGMYVSRDDIEEKWYLRMYVDKTNRMHFEAVSRDGFRIPGGALFNMDHNGIRRMTGVIPELGLALDEKGRITVV